MLAPLSWLKDFVDIDVTPEELEKRLFDSGFEVESVIPYGDKLDNIANNTGDTAKNTDKSSEELSYLRDIAEREAINRFTTAEVRVELGGVTNHVTSGTDLDGVISYLADGLSEALVTAAEGVY